MLIKILKDIVFIIVTQILGLNLSIASGDEVWIFASKNEKLKFCYYLNFDLFSTYVQQQNFTISWGHPKIWKKIEHSLRRRGCDFRFQK